MVNRDALPPEGDYYVTVRDGKRAGFLFGPYGDLRDALADKPRAIKLACEQDDRAWWYSYGTARLPHSTPCRTVFDGPA